MTGTVDLPLKLVDAACGELIEYLQRRIEELNILIPARPQLIAAGDTRTPVLLGQRVRIMTLLELLLQDHVVPIGRSALPKIRSLSAHVSETAPPADTVLESALRKNLAAALSRAEAYLEIEATDFAGHRRQGQ